MNACYNGIATWLGSTEGLYTYMAVFYFFGIGTGLGIVAYLPIKIRQFLGLQ